jgi:hypothetical protein
LRGILPARAGLLTLLVCLASTSGATAQDEAELRAKYAALLQQKSVLEREKQIRQLQAELSESDEPYLVIDLEDRAVHVVVRTTTATSIPFESSVIEQDPPPAAQADGSAWAQRVFHLGGKSGPAEEPEEILPGELADQKDLDPRTITPETIGLDDEEEIPSRYTLLYREGLAIQVGGTALRPEQKNWMERLIEKVGTAFSSPELPEAEGAAPVHVWVRIDLKKDQAQVLYPTAFLGMRTVFRLPGDPRF